MAAWVVTVLAMEDRGHNLKGRSVVTGGGNWTAIAGGGGETVALQ